MNSTFLKTIIAFLSLFPILSIGQVKIDTLRSYCHYASIDNGSSCYRFNQNKSFHFKEQGDLAAGGTYATGTYQIQDSLLLIEYTTEPLLISNIEKRVWDELSDSITVRIKVNNIREVCGVPCISVKFNGKFLYQNKDYGIELRLKKQQKPIEMAALAIGYHTVYLAFAGDISSEASFDLMNQGIPLSGFTEKAKILTVKDGLVTAIEFENGAKIYLSK
jgi:hypothetical protein